MIQLGCSGSEHSLLQCNQVARQPVGLHTCDHSNDAGVRCIGEESESWFAVEDKADKVSLEYVVSAHHLNYPSNACTKFLACGWKDIYYEHTLMCIQCYKHFILKTILKVHHFIVSFNVGGLNYILSPPSATFKTGEPTMYST